MRSRSDQDRPHVGRAVSRTRRGAWLWIAWLVGLAWASIPVPAGAQDNPFADNQAPVLESPFRAELVASPLAVGSGGETTLEVVLRVPADHYVYAERTRLEILPVAGVEILGVEGPVSKTKFDPFLEEDVQVYESDARFTARLRVGWPVTVQAVVHNQGCTSTFCFFPESDTLLVELAVSKDAVAPLGSSPPALGAGVEPEAAARLHAAANRGLFWLLLLAFGAGVATSLTPCVYPMIPITIGIIGARSAGRRSKGFSLSLLYVLGIAVTYSALGTSAALTGALFGSILQNPWVLGGVAVIFGAMALSMFGAFDLQVPASFAGRMNRVQGNGYPGSFLLGMVAGVVASPCIGPVLVAMLAYVAATGNTGLGFMLFFTFALGLGLLFVVLGTFTGLLTSLPKSGNWMDRIKVGFGILFIVLALYYLQPLLPEGRSLAIVGAVLLGLGFVLGGLRMAEATESSGRRWRKAAGRAALVGGLYAVFVPAFSSRTVGVGSGPQWLHSETEGLLRAQAEGKPMLVDFSAEWCTACKELDLLTFSDDRVISLSQQFVPVKVDATHRTPEIETLIQKYGIAGLPWVAFVRPDGSILTHLTVTGFIDADAMLTRMRQALPAAPTTAATSL